MRRTAYIAIVLLLTATTALAQHVDPRIEAFREFARDAMKAQHVEGLSVAVRHGDFQWSGGIGLSDVENLVLASEKTSYRMASVTKPMTAVAVLELVEAGRMDLDAEVQTYVPWFPRKAHPVTIRQLLAHQGGISHYRDYAKEGRIREPKTTREAIEIFADFDLIAEPGTRYSYTTYGYNLLGAAIEGATGQPYAAVMEEKVWKPLGMTATRMDDPRAIIPHRAPGYVLEGGTLRRSEYVDISSRFAGGGTRSTVDDMVAFMDGLAAGKVLTPATLETAWTALPTRTGQATEYGLGFGVYARNGRWVVGHNGSQQETRTAMASFPRAGFTYAIASNYEHIDIGAFAEKLIEIFLGDPPLPALAFDAESDQRTWRALQMAYENGLSYFDRHRRPMTSDRRELAAAFKAFHAAATGDLEQLREGAHPSGGDLFTKVGSWMASVLVPRSLDAYHHAGALAFFTDYSRLAKSHRLEHSLANRIVIWTETTAITWPAGIGKLDLRSSADLAMLERHAASLAKLPVKPDYIRDLLTLAEEKATSGDFTGAAKTAAIGVQIYPESAGLNGVLGVLTVLGGDRERGVALLRKSKERDASGYAGPQNLLRIANFLASGPMKTGAVALLEAGLAVHPAEESLAARLAELK